MIKKNLIELNGKPIVSVNIKLEYPVNAFTIDSNIFTFRHSMPMVHRFLCHIIFVLSHLILCFVAQSIHSLKFERLFLGVLFVVLTFQLFCSLNGWKSIFCFIVSFFLSLSTIVIVCISFDFQQNRSWVFKPSTYMHSTYTNAFSQFI